MDGDCALIICNEEEYRDSVIASVLRCGLIPICCFNAEGARTLLLHNNFRTVLCSDILPDGGFQTVLKEIKTHALHVPLIVLSRVAEWEAYLRVLGAGAFDYILCPPNPAEMERIIRCALSDAAQRQKPAPAFAGNGF